MRRAQEQLNKKAENR
jgi:hypothetical protein